jgi:hypothetical protein
MFFRSTLNYFFSSKLSEQTPLLTSDDEKIVNEVLVDSDKTAKKLMTVSIADKQRSKNLATYQTKPRLGVLKEVPIAIRLLKDSKKNLASYRKMEQSRLNCIGVFNITLILATPGISFTLMFMFHQRLSAIVWGGINAISPRYQHAANEHSTLINWYNEINQEIYNREDPVGYKRNNPCLDQIMQRYPYILKYDLKFRASPGGLDCEREHYIGMATPHYPSVMPDYCAMNQTQYTNPECNQLTDYLCDAIGGLFTCMDEYTSHLPEYQAKKAQFESQHASHMAELETTLDQLGPRLQALNNQSTWEPISTTFFAVATGLCSAWAIYLYRSWSNAKQEYENDINGLHPLEECLDKFIDNEHDRNYIINLAKELKISIKNFSLESLVDQLEKTTYALQKESSITFLMIVNRYGGLPREVSGLILEKAELPVLRPR